jgi:hypothetical protein
MPWLLGGGLLLALFLGSRATTTAPALVRPAPAPPSPFGPVGLPTGHVLHPMHTPPPPAPPALGDTGTSVFQLQPYGQKPLQNTIAWWVNHYAHTHPAYVSGETIASADVATAVHNALLHAGIHEVNDLKVFAYILGNYGFTDEGQLVLNQILLIQEDAITPYVLKYAGTTVLTKANLLKAIATAKTTAPVADLGNFGELLIGYSDLGVGWDSYGYELVALANAGGTGIAPTPAPPSTPAPPPPAKKPIATTPPAIENPGLVAQHLAPTKTTSTKAAPPPKAPLGG